MRVSTIASDVFIGLRRNFTMTVAVVITTFIALSFFGAGLLFSRQVATMKGYWYDKVEVSIFLCAPGDETRVANCSSGPVTFAQRDAVQQELNDMVTQRQVAKIYYESNDEAFKRFKEMFKGSAISEGVDKKYIPESFRVKLVDPKRFDIISTRFATQQGVEEVNDSKAPLEKFFAVLNRLQFAAFCVAGLAILAAALLISNTIRIAAYSRRRETGIMRLVGASNFYIQLPFLIEGALAGLVGAALTSLGIVLFQKFVIVDQAQQQFKLIAFIGWPDVWAVVPWVFVFGVALSSMASFVTLRKYLRV